MRSEDFIVDRIELNGAEGADFDVVIAGPTQQGLLGDVQFFGDGVEGKAVGEVR